MTNDLSTLLGQIQRLWESQLVAAKQSKERDFGRTAADVMRFAGKRYKRIALEPKVDSTSEAMGPDDPEFVAIYNMTDAFRSTMVPYVFSQVHDFLVSPRRPQMPPELASLLPEMAEQQKVVRTRDSMTCFLMQWLLNYFPKLYNLEREGRMVVDEALTKGRGCAWIVMDDGPTGSIPAMYADSVDNLYIDADCRQLREAGWICQKVDESIYKIAERYKEDASFLRGHAATNLQQAVDSTVQAVDVTLLASDHNDPEITKRDIGTYYRIWSRVGLGDKFVGAPDEMTVRDGKVGEFVGALEEIGPYVHFAIMPGMNRPLGMKPENLMGDAGIPMPDKTESDYGAGPGPEAPVDATNPSLIQVLTEKLQWPIKTYGDVGNPWPVKCFDPKPNVNDPWAKSILEAALPIQEVMDHIYNTITVRVKAAGRDICITSSALEKAIRDALQSEDDLPIVPVQGAVGKEEMEKLIGFIRFPEMNKDIFEVLPLLERSFNKITGMDDTQQGMNPQTQERSAAASQLKGKGLYNRADDYAKRAEIWMSEVAEVCGVTTRQYVDVETVAPLFGEPVQKDPASGQPIYGSFTQAFIKFIQLPQDDPHTPYIAAAEYEYSVAAGSGQPKNLQLYQANADRMWTMFGQAAFAGGMTTGDFQPWVELATLIGDAYRMPIQAFLDSFVRMAQIQVQMQQQGAPGETGPDGQPRPRPEGGGPPAQQAESIPGGRSIDTGVMRNAMKVPNLGPPPQGAQ